MNLFVSGLLDYRTSVIVRVSVSAPANAGPAITDYDYRHRAGSPQGLWTEVTTTITALGATIEALAEDTEYVFHARA